jgi:hypothetical protein
VEEERIESKLELEDGIKDVDINCDEETETLDCSELVELETWEDDSDDDVEQTADDEDLVEDVLGMGELDRELEEEYIELEMDEDNIDDE